MTRCADAPEPGPGVDREIALALSGPGVDAVAGARAPARGTSRVVHLVLLAPRRDGGPAGRASHVLRIDLDELGVPVEAVRVAAGRLRTSPLYPLVRNHVVHVTVEAPALAHGAAATALGATTVDLVRALILSVVGDPQAPGDARGGSATARIQAYVAAHLRDPDLSPARIAAANAVSTRTLYAVYQALGTSLARSILDQRLEGARADLASPGRRHHSVAAIARSWGFRNPSSFAQQFGRAFGTTPRQCRRQVHARRP